MSTMDRNAIAEHWIEGTWGAGDQQHAVETVSPATGESVGRVPDGGETECRAAIAAAKRAFERTEWPQHPRLRAGVLLSAAAKIEEKGEGRKKKNRFSESHYAFLRVPHGLCGECFPAWRL